MVFTQPVFLFLLLPIALIGFYAFAGWGMTRTAIVWVIAASLVFYGWWNWWLLGVLAISLFVNFGLARRLAAAPSSTTLALGIAFNLGLLAYYKYANFALAAWTDLTGFSAMTFNVALPLAISFFTFQKIAYLVDTYRGQTMRHGFLYYCLFITFFPQLVAGPILRHADTIPQCVSDSFGRFRTSNLFLGALIFVIGFDKKVFLADSMAILANPIFDGASAHPPGLLDAWSGALAYTLQLYFDFSGYSDMAIGLARMFGIRLPVNFNSPYKATSIIDFWRRWHMTLSSFLRDYLYVPLGGNRKGRLRRYANVMIVMLLGGLWHGAGWTFVAWGALHGAFLVINHGFRDLRQRLGHDVDHPTRWGQAIARAITFLAVVIAWVVFRAEDGASATAVLRGLLGLNGFGASQLDGTATTWILPLLAIAWFGPNTQEILARHAPALDFSEGSDLSARAMARWHNWIDAFEREKAYVLIPFVSGSAVLAIFIAMARGAVSTEFIYMIF